MEVMLDGFNANAGYLAFFSPADFGEPQFFINNYPQSAWQAFGYPNFEYIVGEEVPYTLYLSYAIQNSVIDLTEVSWIVWEFIIVQLKPTLTY